MIVKRYPTPREVAQALIEEIIIPSAERAPISLAVSGGGTPRLLFELMASDGYHSLRWDNLNIYWVDERCVPPTDTDSNYGMTYDALLSHVPIPEAQIHRIFGELDPTAEALRYTKLVKGQLDIEDGLPIFDLVLLGVGDDGHTSSIFPHEMELLTELTPYVVTTSPKGQKRICLTGPTILKARTLIFHAVGAGKQSILSAIHHHTPESEAYPSTHIAQHRADVYLYTDQSL